MVDQEYATFAHLTSPNAALYRRVMATFLNAKRRFTVHLRPEDVHEQLDDAPEMSVIDNALTQLVEWGNLRADPDTSRVTTVEDFHRARFLYQLTQQGEATEKALSTYDEELGRRGALQAVALTDIATQLRVMLTHTGDTDVDPGKVYLALQSLVTRFSDLADNAQAFMSSLQRTIDLHDAAPDTFRAYKDRLIDYLERFIKDLVSTGSEIAGLIDSVERAGLQRLLDIAAWREAEDAAPGSPDVTATPDDTEDTAPRRHAFQHGRVIWHDRWNGFRAWFVSDPHHPSQAKLLRSQARAAIPQLLQVVAALNERRTGRSDRTADFRALARWFAQAPDEASLHRLWRSAFGLSSSRHLTADTDQDHTHRDGTVRPGTPWASAPPLSISPRLRKTGSYERRGRPNRVVDRTAQRQYLAELTAKEAAETAAARAALATDRPTHLSEIGSLEPDAFQLFLGLIGDALAARTPGTDTVHTTTSDGSMTIRLSFADATEQARIHTPHGVFHGPDLLVDITDLTTADSDREEPSA